MGLPVKLFGTFAVVLSLSLAKATASAPIDMRTVKVPCNAPHCPEIKLGDPGNPHVATMAPAEASTAKAETHQPRIEQPQPPAPAKVREPSPFAVLLAGLGVVGFIVGRYLYVR
jgi:hypothetical protein